MEEKKSDGEETFASAASASLLPSPAKVEPSFTAPYGPNVRVSKHPVLAHKLSVLRSSSTPPSAFRSVLAEITFHLGYEATSTLATRDVSLTVPHPSPTADCDRHVDAVGRRIRDRVALIPILRSGLGMVDSMLGLVDDAAVHHVGMYRTRGSPSVPVQYYNRLPKKCDVDVAYVLDPLVATGDTVISVVGILKKWGVSEIHVISVVASKQGLSRLLRHHPEVRITIGCIDEELNAEGFVVPGLGDAGDRLFKTSAIGDEDECLVHHSKRKRTMSVDSNN